MATTVVALPQSNTPRKKSPVGRIVIYALLNAATLKVRPRFSSVSRWM